MSIGLILLIYIVYKVLGTISNYKELVKMFATLILPLPIAIYLAFILASRQDQEGSIGQKEILISITIFILTTFAIVILIFQYDKIGKVLFRDLKILPLFINSLLLFSYSANYLMIKNLKLSGMLSGLLLGFAIYFFL